MAQSPTLPPIELHVLEVEPLPAPRVPPPQEKQPGDAVKRWREVAVRVMTEIAMGQDPFEGKSESSKSDSISPVPEKKSDGSKPRSSESDSKISGTKMPPLSKGKKQGKPQKVAWGNSPTPRTPSSPNRQTKYPGRAPVKKKAVVEPSQKVGPGGGQKFASLVRLARFRKMSVRKMDDEKKEEQEEEEEEIVPVKPRFCTSMSPEAQYAMLKGYEDMLLNTLQTKVRSDRREALYRVRTPHKPVRSLYLAEQHLDDDDNTTQKIIPLNEDNVEHFSRHTSVPKIPSLPPRESSMARTSSLSGNFHGKDITKDKQLRLTSRFERAHDILDSVRMSQGNLVTSPRALQKVSGKKQKNPRDHYNAWSHAWAKEFKLLYGTTQQHVTIE